MSVRNPRARLDQARYVDGTRRDAGILKVLGRTGRYLQEMRATSDAPSAVAAPARQASSAPAPADGPPSLRSLAPDTSTSHGTHDQLTELLNRHGLELEIGEALERSDRDYRGTLIAVGLDNFRSLNANRGSETCDEVLSQVGALLRRTTPQLHAIGRTGGDAFGLLLTLTGRVEVEAAVESLLETVRSTELIVHEDRVRVTASAGVTVLDRVDLAPGDALLEADFAMAQAKQAGRDRYAFYEQADHGLFGSERSCAEQIREALESDGFALVCQPVHCVKLPEPTQWELFLTLPQSDGETMAAAAFMPAAERFGLIERVDTWVFERAVELILSRTNAGQPIRLELNISAQTLASNAFAELVASRIQSTWIDPRQVVFEVNELVLADNPEDVKIFAERLTRLGCGFALDNFGTSQASLVHLKQLPLDYVKIDGSLVRQIAASQVDQHLVRAIIELAHGFGQQVIATQVEDRETLELLQSWDVDRVQGFHIARPEPISTLLA